MKKLLIILLILFIIFPLVNIDSKINKTEYKVFETLEKEEVVRVNIEHYGNLEVEGKRHVKENEFSMDVTLNELENLEENHLVKSISQVPEYTIFLDSSVPVVNASPVWNTQFSETNLTGAGETVCIMDTGANFSHPDLLGKNLTCIIDCVNASCVENCSKGDSHTHGTHVAGIIGANGSLKGVAPDANLIMVQVCYGTGCRGDDIEAGLTWCIDNADTYNVSVISMSLGADCSVRPDLCYSSYCNSDDLTNEVNTAVGNNITVVIASGNNGNKTHISSPSCIENATTVSATTDADIMWTSSNRNGLVDLVAPGYSINSTVPSGYDVKSGTSMATPHVSGAFALINQMRRLEGNSGLTVAQIQTTLNLTGKTIDDTGNSAWNYSRIDIYATALSLDSKGPTINLVTPANNAASALVNQTFTCNSSDELQLSNLSIVVWNSTGNVVNETSFDASSNFLESSINETLTPGNYTWSCFSYDGIGNYEIASNYSLTISELYVLLETPANNTYTSANETNFTCSFSTNNTLVNSTFYLWNSTNNLIYNETALVSGEQNSSTFNYTLNETNYFWNCLIVDSEIKSNFSENNFTVTYDSTNPVISLNSPADSLSTTSTSIEFEFSVTETNIANCSLILDDSVIVTNSSVTQVQNSFTQSLNTGTYAWKINCEDLAGNEINSSSRSLTITSSSGNNPGSGPSSSPSSAPAATPTTLEYDLSASELKQGVRKVLSKDDSLNFELKNESHNLSITRVLPDSVELVIYSEPITVNLVVGEHKKLNLNNDEFYDLFVQLNSITFPEANLTIQEIHEEISVYTVLDEDTTPQEIKWFTGDKIIWLIVIVAVILIVFVGYLFLKIYWKKLLSLKTKKGDKTTKKDIW